MIPQLQHWQVLTDPVYSFALDFFDTVFDSFAIHNSGFLLQLSEIQKIPKFQKCQKIIQISMLQILRSVSDGEVAESLVLDKFRVALNNNHRTQFKLSNASKLPIPLRY